MNLAGLGRGGYVTLKFPKKFRMSYPNEFDFNNATDVVRFGNQRSTVYSTNVLLEIDTPVAMHDIWPAGLAPARVYVPSALVHVPDLVEYAKAPHRCERVTGSAHNKIPRFSNITFYLASNLAEFTAAPNFSKRCRIAFKNGSGHQNWVAVEATFTGKMLSTGSYVEPCSPAVLTTFTNSLAATPAEAPRKVRLAARINFKKDLTTKIAMLTDELAKNTATMIKLDQEISELEKYATDEDAFADFIALAITSGRGRDEVMSMLKEKGMLRFAKEPEPEEVKEVRKPRVVNKELTARFNKVNSEVE